MSVLPFSRKVGSLYINNRQPYGSLPTSDFRLPTSDFRSRETGAQIVGRADGKWLRSVIRPRLRRGSPSSHAWPTGQCGSSQSRRTIHGTPAMPLGYGTTSPMQSRSALRSMLWAAEFLALPSQRSCKRRSGAHCCTPAGACVTSHRDEQTRSRRRILRVASASTCCRTIGRFTLASRRSPRAALGCSLRSSGLTVLRPTISCSRGR